MKPTSLSTIADVLADYFSTGNGVREIASKHGINPTSVSLYISRFIHAFGDAPIRESTPQVKDQKPKIDFTEEYLLALADKDFKFATGIDPNNRYADCVFIGGKEFNN